MITREEEQTYTCEEVRERLDDYLDQELSSSEMQRILEHLQGCMACSATAQDAYNDLASLREAIQEIALPEGLLNRVSWQLAQNLAPECIAEGKRPLFFYKNSGI